MLLALSVPANQERGPLYMDQALAAIHQGNPQRLPVSLELGRRGDHVSLFCRCPDALRTVVAGQIYAHYPDCKIERVADDTLEPPPDTNTWTAELHLHPDIFPLKRYGQFEDALNRVTADPLTALLTALARDPADRLHVSIRIEARPARTGRRARAFWCLRTLSAPFFRANPWLSHWYLHLALSPRWPLRLLGWLFSWCGRHNARHGPADPLHTSASRLHEREDDLQAASDKLGKLLFEVHICLVASGPKQAAAEAARKLREIAGAFGPFSSPRLAAFHASPMRRLTSPPRRSPAAAFLLSTEELATLFHPPTTAVRAPTMTVVQSREFEPPVTLPTPRSHPAVSVLGVTLFRSHRQRFGILPDDRFRHVAILGKTGMGKSTLLHHLITSDIQVGRGVALIDPHGDLVEAVLRAVPRQRTNDVILFDAGDAAFPLAFNPLACPNPELRPLIASGVVSAFKKLYGDSWGPRLEHILRNALLTLLEVPGTTLVSVLRLLGDARYRQALVGRLTDPVVRAFWEGEFARMPPKFQAEAIAPIQNKVGHFVSSPLLRNIVGQPHTRLDLRRVMDEGKVLLVNLSRGRVGDDASALLGALLVSSLQRAAMSRADQPEQDRRDFFLYVDEFQNFATESFGTILSEARKYRLALTLANQYLAQLDDATRSAVFRNVGTLAVFQVGAEDAEALAQQLGGDLTEQDLLQLPRFAAYLRLLIDGMPSRPFSMQTLPPHATAADALREAIIRRHSRRRYAQPVATVDAQVRQALVSA